MLFGFVVLYNLESKFLKVNSRKEDRRALLLCS